MSGAAASPLRSAGVLALAGLLAAGLLGGLDGLTRERIAEQARTLELERLAAVLPHDRYDNDPLDDTITVTDPRLGPGEHLVRRGRLGGRPSALALTATATGYAGPIRLLIGVAYDGRVLGVRVLEHQETPGLGDPIEERRSPWIHGFDGRHLGDPGPEAWTVHRDGGAFDQFAGATITPRAVAQAVRRVLEYHAGERERLYRD